jgi:hypothetical protein
MPKPTMLISIETNKDTVSKDFGRSFIQSLCDEDPRLVPEKLSETENYKNPYLGVEDYWVYPRKGTKRDWTCNASVPVQRVPR